jgi:primary-amine oxidase
VGSGLARARTGRAAIAVTAGTLAIGAWIASDHVASGKSERSAAPAFVDSHPQASPVDPLSAAEIKTTFRVIEASPKFPKGAFFNTVRLQDPPKAEVLAWSPGKPFSRRAFADVYDRRTNRLYQVVVDLRAKRLVSWKLKPGAQPPVSETEYEDAASVIQADPRWQRAMRRRGIPIKDVYLDVWAPGEVRVKGSRPGTRYLRALSFYQRNLGSKVKNAKIQPNPYDRPIEGVVVTVDMNRMKVVDVTDSGARPVEKKESGDAGVNRLPLTPLQVVQPKGPNFRIDGTAVSWEGWHFRVGYDTREGLVLWRIGFGRGGKVRPIVYRMAMDEIYVPYALPDPNWTWRTAFDIGEYNLGQYAEPLKKGVDVPTNAYFFNEATPSDTGTSGGVYPLPHAIAMYEQDSGSLWDRTDPTSYERDARFARELVVTATYVIGNYTYSTNYVFRLDGGMDVRVSATGTTLNQGVPGPRAGETHGTPVLPIVAAPAHQHFFNFRIDFDVDGPANRVVEQNAVSSAGSRGNGFTIRSTSVKREGFRDADEASARQWVVESTTHRNRLGRPTGYAVTDLQAALPLSGPRFPPLLRAPFAAHPVWVTRYREGQLYAAGDYPNQGHAGSGLSRYAAGRTDVSGKDLVLWVTTGFTHIPEPEEYPVMTSEGVGFSIRPAGFFDGNPALDVP